MKLLALNLFTQKADFCRLRTFDFLLHGIKKECLTRREAKALDKLFVTAERNRIEKLLPVIYVFQFQTDFMGKVI